MGLEYLPTHVPEICAIRNIDENDAAVLFLFLCVFLKMIQKKTWDAWNVESQMLCSVVLGKGGGSSSNNECFLFEDDVAEVRK